MKKYVFDSRIASLRIERALYEYAKEFENSMIIYPANKLYLEAMGKFEDGCSSNLKELLDRRQFRSGFMCIDTFMSHVMSGDIRQLGRLIFPDYSSFLTIERRELYKMVITLGVKEAYCMANFDVYKNSIPTSVHRELISRVKQFKTATTNFDSGDVNRMIDGLNVSISLAYEYLYNFATDRDAINLNM